MADLVKIKETVIVEGRDDTINLKRAVDCFTIETHGFGIRRETWEQIEKAYSERGIIIFTDPDHSGEEIRRKLTERFPDAGQAYIARKDALKKGDVGVENAEPEVIAGALLRARDLMKRKAPLEEDISAKDPITMNDLDELGLSGGEGSRELRQEAGKALGIGYANAKGFLRKLSGFGIKREELYEAIFTIRNKGDQR
ncbi:MAG: ribonuclease M5 [Firmicutes bacterium]|nr:ribonuclease M5 [Bacillota bacterium]